MEVENLKAYLANINMTIVQFAQILECDPGYLSRVMRGKGIPSRRLARDIRLATSGVINLKTNTLKWQERLAKKQKNVA